MDTKEPKTFYKREGSPSPNTSFQARREKSLSPGRSHNMDNKQVRFNDTAQQKPETRFSRFQTHTTGMNQQRGSSPFQYNNQQRSTYSFPT